jgi:hypothetical protein
MTQKLFHYRPPTKALNWFTTSHRSTFYFRTQKLKSMFQILRLEEIIYEKIGGTKDLESVWFANFKILDSIRQNKYKQMFTVLNKFCLVRYLVDKILFWYFRQCMQRTKSWSLIQRVIESLFLSSPLIFSLSNSTNSFKIKHNTTEIVLFSFLI